MSKKTKKAQIAENLETTNQTSEESQMEATNNTSEEAPPATIVECSEFEVFATQTEGQETVNIDEVESHIVENSAVATEGEAVEQATPAKKERVSKRPYIALVEEHFELGDLDKKELLALIMERFPTISKNGASTFLTDALNPRYSHWKDRVVSKTVDGKMIFADKIEEPAPDAQPAEAQSEQSAE